MRLLPNDSNWIPVHGVRVRLQTIGEREVLNVAGIARPEQIPMFVEPEPERRVPARLPVPQLLRRKLRPSF